MKRLLFILFFSGFQLYAGKCISEDLTQQLTDRDFTYLTLQVNDVCRAVAVWSVDISDIKHIQAAYFDGESWTIPATNEFISDSDSAEFPSIALNDAGQAVALWKAGEKARVSSFSFGDVLSGWSTPLDIGNARQAGDENDFFCVGIDDQGLAIAVWPDFNDASFVLSSRSPDGIVWTLPEKLSGDLVQNAHPYLAVSKGGHAIAVWRAVDALAEGIGEIRFAYFDSGGWNQTDKEVISRPTINYHTPFVAINDGNKALVSWIRDNPNSQVVQSLFLDADLNRSVVTTLSPDILDNIIDIQRAALSSSNEALVVWSLRNDPGEILPLRRVQYAHYKNSWHVPEDNDSFIIDNGYGPHVRLNALGQGAVLYISLFGEDLIQENLALSLFQPSTAMWASPQVFLGINPSESDNGSLYSLGAALSAENSGGFISRNFYVAEEEPQIPVDQNPEFITSTVCCNTQAVSAPSSPTNITGKLGVNRFAMHAEAFAELYWQLSSDSDIYAQRIYRDGVLIASIPATESEFTDHNLSRPLPSEYIITAVNRFGLESAPARVML